MEQAAREELRLQKAGVLVAREGERAQRDAREHGVHDPEQRYEEDRRRSRPPVCALPLIHLVPIGRATLVHLRVKSPAL